MGKGAGLFMILELISYLLVSLFPLALPLAILISSVMVLGGMAENYELASFKSAGVPLVRVLFPLAIISVFIGGFSFLCSNYIIPVTNLQFKSRLYDIRKQKPTLSLKEGMFNDDFKGYTIYIGKKGEDGKEIEEIIIYDDKNTSSKGLSQITAARGNMYMTEDDRYFIMNLYDGLRSEEANRSYKSNDKTYPFIRTKFKEHQLIFDLGQFDINETDKDLFKTHQSVMSIDQLKVATDSLTNKIDDRYTQLHKNVFQHYYFEKKRDTSLFKVKKKTSTKQETNKKIKEEQLKDNKVVSEIKQKQQKVLDSVRVANRKNSTSVPKLKQIKQREDLVLDTLNYLADTFREKDKPQLYSRAKSSARSILSAANSAERSLTQLLEKRVKHIYIKHTKITYAIICFFFLFIGGPMGAIVRKGGFGYPILVSVGFFVIFIVMTMACEKLAESHVFPAGIAAWIPVTVIGIMGTVITYKAMNESATIDLTAFSKLAEKMSSFFR